MKRQLSLAVLVFFLGPGAQAQAQNESKPERTIVLKAARMLDVKSGNYISGAAVLIEGERIKEAGNAAEIVAHAPKNAEVLDLGEETILPGLIDCHTHLLLRVPSGPDGYILNLATKSVAFRALEGAANARVTLEAGFTTVRDVENEGSGYADVALRDAVNQGLVAGPRMQVATRAIAAIGQYEPFGVSPDLTDFPHGAQMVSGVEEARRAVREQIGNGADLIKLYADWDYPTLTVEEMTVIVEEAHKLHRKVAAHATTAEGIHNALVAGVDSIEHGHRADRADIEMMKAKGVFLVPTLSPIDRAVARRPAGEPLPPRVRQFLEGIAAALRMAKELGVKIADGSDPDDVNSHGNNAAELMAMTKRGLTPLEAIQAATVNASELMSWESDVGSIEAGRYADIIGVQGDPLADVSVLKDVRFVMKGGELIKSAKNSPFTSPGH